MTATSAKKLKGKSREVLEESIEAEIPAGKFLVHTDKKIRDKAFKGLVAFLSQGSGKISEMEMTKLWKSLFYCFWMSDKPLVQQAFANDLAELLLLINPSSELENQDRNMDRFQASIDFLNGFWEAIVREWHGLDRLRIDKYLLLIRRYVNATFRLLARENWSISSVEAVNSILGGPHGPLTWQDRKVPAGLANHLADVYLEELDKVLALPEVTSKSLCPLVLILQPHITLLARTPTPTIHSRLMMALFHPLLSALNRASPIGEEHSEGEEPSAKRAKRDEPIYAHIIMHSTDGRELAGAEIGPGAGALKVAILKAMFSAASDEHAVESNRRRVYVVWREENGDDD
ncbi:hypothetical protein TREMEDRAFT_28117 [Tremella mesenterica DSM 1558]|uniref:uncharacterized protein n=1 Tax=Tremella mesenterica (strain ATCC 24925 / CBS 8224 / DSM 1558 / NBRC 9311 / NRRL Y-6157 / RJB 2259-6 / UBC 559-6) TaxID=578456 RepID=UPI0003F49611|nr:uncharacterized protein TREMEDRAFT_28117 [Tremella mesenterica DSM 1558]EIW71503.1 hypothetical protein TREMEDRAFT_28117 [Tremella mesenterica DSM 1558]